MKLSRERRGESGGGENGERKVINHVKKDEQLQWPDVADPASCKVFAAQIARFARDKP